MIDKIYDQLLLLIGGAIFLLGFIKILTYYLIASSKTHMGGKKLYAEDIIKKQKAPKQQEEEFQRLLNSKEIAELNLGSYECAKDLFNTKMHAGKLNREQILFLKKVLNTDLGDNTILYNKKYKNDCHEIYSKLKSHYLTKEQLQQFSSYVYKF